MFKNKANLLLILLVLATSIGAQNNTNSPYTQFGYGEITGTYSGEQKAMGGTSLGVRTKNGINTMNPASYSNVDSTSFMFDFGVLGLLSRFSTPQGSKSSFNSNIDYLNMQFPLFKNMGFSAGLLPYSFSGYNFHNTSYLPLSEFPDTVHTTRTYAGYGGISQVYAGLAYEFFDHISVGVNAYYMFGSSVNARQLTFSSTSINSSAQSDSITVANLRLRYGLQAYHTFSKKHYVNIGFIFEPKQKLNARYSQATGSVLTELTAYQPVFSSFETPEIYGGGLSYTFNNKLTIASDFQLTKWGDALFMGVKDTLNNQTRISLGAEYQPDERGRYYERMYYRAGLNVSDAYYKIGGLTQPKNIGISFGIGLPLKNSSTIINTTIEYGRVGSSSFLREDYFRFTVNAAFNEFWFFKRKL